MSYGKKKKQIIEQPKQKNQYSTKQKEDVKIFLAKLQIGDLCFEDIIDYGYACLGQTKAGKTTLTHHLINNTLKGVQKNNETYYELGQNSIRFKQAIIGQTTQSQTQIPNECIAEVKDKQNQKKHKVNLIDCPGYSDSKGCFMVIANGYFHYRVFSKVKNLKFILTFDINLLEGVMQKPANTIEQFFLSFKKIELIKDEIFNATVFVFTKANTSNLTKFETQNNLKQKIQKLKNCSCITNKKNGKLMIELIDHIVKKNKFFIFSRARNGQVAESNTMLQEIHQKTDYWTRDLIPDETEVDLTYVQMSLGYRARELASKQEKFKYDFQLLTSQFTHRFTSAFKHTQNKCNLEDLFIQFLSDSLVGKPEKRDFYLESMLNFLQKYNIYNNQQIQNNKQQYNKKRNKIKNKTLNIKNEAIDSKNIAWIQKLQICNLIIQLALNKYYELAGKRSIQSVKRVSKDLLSIMSQFKKIKFFEKVHGSHANKDQYVKDSEQFLYVVYRLLQQAKTFKIIFETDTEDKKQPKSSNNINLFTLNNMDITTIIYDFVQSLAHFDGNGIQFSEPNAFEKYKQRYFGNLQIKEQEGLEYYIQIEDYYKDIEVNKVVNQKLSALTTVKLKSGKSKMDKNQKIYSLTENIKNYSRALNFQNSNHNIETYIEFANQLAEELANISAKHNQSKQQNKKALKFAILIFKQMNNVYRVIECYKHLCSKYDNKKQASEFSNMLLQFALYASKHGRMELSIQVYQHAYSLIEKSIIQQKDGKDIYQLRQEERAKIAKLIGMLGIQKKYSPSQSYYNQLLQGDIFSKLQDSLLVAIQNQFPRNKK